MPAAQYPTRACDTNGALPEPAAQRGTRREFQRRARAISAGVARD
jgi:hypothetical protein